MAATLKFITLPNQVGIPYVEQGDRARIPLILLHGFADSLHTFELILPLLPDFIHALAFTQRGHSEASGPDIGYRTRDFASDLLQFMDALQIEKAVLVGASSGGLVARRFALDHPDRTLGLVLLGSPATLQDNPQVRETIDSTFAQLTDPVDPEFIRTFNQGMIASHVPQEFMDIIIKETSIIPAKVWREAGQGLLEEGFPGGVDQITIPTLIIWGDRDPLLPRSGQEALAQAIKGSRLVVYPGIGHMVYWEAPDRVAADLVDFMKSIAA